MLQRRTPLFFSALACALSIAVAVPASATGELGPEEPPVESDAALHSSDLGESALGETARIAPSGGGTAYFTVNERTHPVAPGLELKSFDRYDARGWIRVDALIAQMATPGLRLDYAAPGKVSSGTPARLSVWGWIGSAG